MFTAESLMAELTATPTTRRVPATHAEFAAERLAEIDTTPRNFAEQCLLRRARLAIAESARLEAEAKQLDYGEASIRIMGQAWAKALEARSYTEALTVMRDFVDADMVPGHETPAADARA